MVDDMTEDRLLKVLDEALSARVVEELPRAVGRYQFTHALIQETLAEELTITRKVRLHARIAEALEQLYGDAAEAHASELAHHFSEAQTVLGTGKLVHYSRLAGDRALSGFAYEEALVHFERGLVSRGIVLTGSEPAQDAEAAGLLFGLGRSQSGTLDSSQVGEAVTNVTRAFDFYTGVGDVARAVAVAEHRVGVIGAQRFGMAQLVARALELVSPDSHDAGRILAYHGGFLGMDDGDYSGAQEAFSRALDIARRDSDIALETRTLSTAARVDFMHCYWEVSLEKCRRAIELTHHTNDPFAELGANYFAASNLMAMGELEGARLHASAALSAAERLREQSWLGIALWLNESVSSHEGNWQIAREINDRRLLLGPTEILPLCSRVVLEYQIGDFAQGDAYLERVLRAIPTTPPGPTIPQAIVASSMPMAAQIKGAPSGFEVAEAAEAAEAAAEMVLSSPSAMPLVAGFARIGRALLVIQGGNATEAGEQYVALEQLRQRGVWRAPVPNGAVAIDRMLGLLSHTIGILDQVVTHFEDNAAFCRNAGYRPELAWTCCDYADLLLGRNGDGDSEKAGELLDESLAISRELGMRPLMERVLSRREILRA